MSTGSVIVDTRTDQPENEAFSDRFQRRFSHQLRGNALGEKLRIVVEWICASLSETEARAVTRAEMKQTNRQTYFSSPGAYTVNRPSRCMYPFNGDSDTLIVAGYGYCGQMDGCG